MQKVQSTTEKIYYDAWREVYADKRLSKGDLSILVVLNDQNFQGMDIHFSYQTIADRTGQSRRNTIRCIRKLVELGYVQRKYDPDKPTYTNHYIIGDKWKAPWKEYIRLDHLAMRADEQLVASKPLELVTPVTLPSDVVVTSTSDSAVTLMYQGNEKKNERVSESYSDRSLGWRDEVPNKEKGASDSGVTSDIETYSSRWGRLTDQQLWQVAKDNTVMIPTILKKYKDVQTSIENGKTYGRANTDDLLRYFVQKDIDRGSIETGGEEAEMLIDAENPEEKKKFIEEVLGKTKEQLFPVALYM